MRWMKSLLPLFAGLLFNASGASAQVPADLGRGEVRCQDTCCAIGACLLRDLLNDPMRLASSARIIPSMVDGHPHGFRLAAIRPNTIVQQLGLQNGDTVIGING